MIFKSKARAGGRQLAEHVLNAEQNERIEVMPSRGLVTDDPRLAVDEMFAMSAGFSGKKHLTHAHCSPDHEMTVEQWGHVWSVFEKENRLERAPFTEVAHFKEGRVEHRHRIYLRVDPTTSQLFGGRDADRFSKIRDEKISRMLEHEFGHRITHGAHDRPVIKWLRKEGKDEIADAIETAPGELSRRAYSFAENQVQLRSGLDKKQIAEAIAQAWNRADTGTAFKAALEEKGLQLARHSTREGVVVVIDQAGEPHGLARTLRQAGVSAKEVEVRARFGAMAPTLPRIDQTREAARSGIDRPQSLSADEIQARKDQRFREGIERREAEKAAWKEMRRQEFEAAKDTLRTEFAQMRSKAWEREKSIRDSERTALKERFAGPRADLRTIRGTMGRVFRAAFKAVAEKPAWERLFARQNARWDAERPHFRDFVAQRAALDDPQARLVRERWSKAAAADQAKTKIGVEQDGFARKPGLQADLSLKGLSQSRLGEDAARRATAGLTLLRDLSSKFMASARR